MADVLLLLLSLADYNEIDLVKATLEKLALNEARYPAERARGRADKYTAYVEPDEP
jgi:dCTP diphosphatase